MTQTLVHSCNYVSNALWTWWWKTLDLSEITLGWIRRWCFSRNLSRNLLWKIQRHSLLAGFHRLWVRVSCSWKGEKAAWQMKCLSWRFTKLSMQQPTPIGDKDKKVLEKFIIAMYNRSSQATGIGAVIYGSLCLTGNKCPSTRGDSGTTY